MLLDHLDINKDGSIDFQEFLIAIRGQLTPKRQEVVDAAFKKYDPRTTGQISIENLKGEYNCDMNPKVQAGIITRRMAFEEFLSFFDLSVHQHKGTISREVRLKQCSESKSGSILNPEQN